MRALLALALLLIAAPASAAPADWWWVDGSSRTRSMVDRGSIARSGFWATAWLQDFFLAPREANQFSARYLIQHDCARGEATVLSAQAFDGDGRALAAPVPDRSRPSRETLREVCDNDWSRATQAGDVEGEIRLWRVSNDN